MCDKCIKQVIENKKFEPDLKLLIRKAPNQFGHMLPYHKL